MRFSLRNKIISGYAILLILFFGTTIFSIQRIDRLQKNVQMTHDHPLTVTRAVISIEVNITAMHRSMKDVAITQNARTRQKYIDLVKKTELEALENYDIVKTAILGEEGLEMVKKSELEFLNWNRIRIKVIKNMEAGNYEKAQTITKTTGDNYVRNLLANLKALEAYAANKAMGFTQDSFNISRKTRSIKVLLLITSGIISLFISIYLSISFTKRLTAINIATTKMANGNLGSLVEIKGDDEINNLASNFNTMARKLKNLYENLEEKVRQRTTELEKSNVELNQLKSELEKKVEERTIDLADKVRKLNKNKQNMEQVVENLNQTTLRLKEEGEKLDTANKELEAFAYSVSHDLRAPLRAIHGFTKILLEDYIDNLDEEGQRIGKIIQSNTVKMGNLIDYLLQFSRMGRTAIKLTEIDMRHLALSTFKEEHAAHCQREITFSADELPPVTADINMIKQVWTNLISNALKFTANKEKATIKVGYYQEEKTTVYTISDNGAGFDMKYIDKIFGVFQRLHSEREFPGTGVGLAIVERIVLRHNGKIWADSKPNEGAKFFFTLPNPSSQEKQNA